MDARETIALQARDLSATAVSLIRQVIEKHTVAVLEEFRDQVQARNARIAELEAALHRAQWALRQPADDWKSHCERRALDQIREVLPCQEESK